MLPALIVALVLLISGVPLWQYVRGGRSKASVAGSGATDATGAGFPDPLAWLIAQNPRKARMLAAASALAGVGIVALATYWLSQVPWRLEQASPYVATSAGTCGSNGAHYFIQVNGGKYVCGGGDTKCPERTPIEVAYDAQNPAHCRVRSNVDRPSLYELQALLFGLIWLCLGGAVACWRGFDDVYPGASPPLLKQTAAYRTWVALALLLLAALGVSAWFYP